MDFKLSLSNQHNKLTNIKINWIKIIIYFKNSTYINCLILKVMTLV